MIYKIKHGGVWSNGKLVPASGTVELSDEDRERIDPNHTELQSAEEAELESKKLDLEASVARRKAQALSRIDQEHAEKLERDAKRLADEQKKKNEGGAA